jgi:dipeptidyl aminopeptidase/acylaminoacyl peptidase
MDGTIDAGLSFVMLCWPVLDPTARYKMVKHVGRQNLIDAHNAFWKDEAEMAAGNPQLIMERKQETACPPILIIQGTADENLTPDMAENFAAVYQRRGGSVLLKRYVGEGHSFITRDPSRTSSRCAIEELRAFVSDAFLRLTERNG